jgi:hypothetical protein
MRPGYERRAHALEQVDPQRRSCGGLDDHANIRSMREYGFTITEHDSDRPWMVLATEHRTIKLPDGLDFFAWAHEQWPAPRWSVQLDPWQLAPSWAR